MKEKYAISGMNCAACAAHVQDALMKLEGIRECNVSLLLNMAEVEKDDTLSSESIIAAIKESGYGALLYDGSASFNDGNLKQKKRKLIVSILLLVTLSYIAMADMFALPNIPLLNSETNPFNHCLGQFILSLTICIIHFQRIRKGVEQLFKGRPTMDSLIGLSCVASMGYGLCTSVQILFNPSQAAALIHHLYFETGAMVLTFSSIGKYLEEKSKIHTTSALSDLISFMPSFAYKMADGKLKRVKAEEIHAADLFVVKPGQKIVCDGVVTEGHSYNDQSALTGESIPIEKKPNDNVLCGAINLNGTLTVRASCAITESSFSRIIDLVSQAANSKAPISRLADRISSVFVPGVIISSVLTFIIWILSGSDFFTAFSYAMSVLVVSCPCALGLATPTAIMAVTGKAAKMGILYKNAAVIEEAAAIDTLAFDKTNTLTIGSMKVESVNEVMSVANLHSLLYTLEKASDHPLSRAVVAWCENHGANDLGFESIYHIGKGLEAIYDNQHYHLGSADYMKQNGILIKEEDDASLLTTLYLAQNGSLAAVLRLSDPLKPDIRQTLGALKGYRRVLISGDDSKIVQRIGKEIGMDSVYGQIMPEGKQKIISELQKGGHKVAMIGDGINDSVALIQADIGVAISNATDIAAKAADIVLISSHFYDIVNMLKLSRFAITIIKGNLLWALGYNVILIPIASGLLSGLGIHLNPMYCSMAMSLSSLTVVLNALRINTYKPFKLSSKTVKTRYSITLDIDHMMCEHCQRSVENALLNCGIVACAHLNPSVCTFACDEKPDFTVVKAEIEKAGYHLKDVHIQENQGTYSRI